jgi:hypothetical protein
VWPALLACSDYALAPPPPGVGDLQVSPAALTFGPGDAVEERSVVLRNDGGAPVLVGVPTVSGAFSLVQAAAVDLRAGESASLAVRWDPADGPGDGALSLHSGDPDRPEITVPLLALAEDTGTPPTSSGCGVALAAEAAVGFDPVCADAHAAEDPWSPVLEWAFATDDDGVWTMPAVGALADAVPRVAFVTLGGELVVARGDTGAPDWELPGFKAASGVVLADVTGDGAAEVVAASNAGEVIALDGSGAEIWRSVALDLWWSQVTAGDLEGDGDVEVVAGRHVLDGASGALIVSLDPPIVDNPAPVLADVDGDGIREILLGETVHDAAGPLRWSAPTDPFLAFPAVIGGDVWFATNGVVHVFGGDGIARFDVALDPGAPGVPCVGDLDADGFPEIVVPQTHSIGAWHGDGTRLWRSEATSDPTGSAGCSLADLDADGVPEVIYADEDQLLALDGRTGATRFSLPHASSTFTEYPVPVDVDGDGHVEIVVAANDFDGGLAGVRVFGHPDWPNGRTAWGIHDFAAWNQQEDGSLLAVSGGGDWLRGYPGWPADAADLAVAITGSCATSCDGGLVEVAWQVRNEGTVPEPSGAEVVLYAVNGAAETELARATLPEVPAARALAGASFAVSAAELGAAALRIQVVPDTARTRCDAGDDQADAPPVCP